jgi:uncharacterized protein (DUF488 family)
MNKLFTIGHSNHSLEHFLCLLSRHEINTIIDIRSVPYSRYVPHFNKERIKEHLKSNHIHYLYMAEEFGMIQREELFHLEGYVDFEKVRESEHFKTGVERVKRGIEKGYKIALMCSEKDPLECHRSIMIAPVFKKQGYEVLHILEDNRLESQEKFEKRLIDLYFPENNQQNFFNTLEGEKNKEELLTDAMSLRNRDIGYRKKD